jgi:Rad3-related DNA helicase
VQKLISSKYLETFSGTPRPQQEEALEKIDKAFSSGKKYVIACLPTGSGKSHIGVAVAASTKNVDSERKSILENYGIYKRDRNGGYLYEDDFNDKPSYGSYILTVTRSLQDQYQGLFNDIILAKGKNNYNCDVDKNLSVDFAPCLFSANLREDCFSKNRCPYYKTKNEALLSQYPVLNYRYLISLPHHLRRREIFVCDEASQIEDELVGQYSVTVPYSFLAAENIPYKKLISDDSDEAGRWLQDIYILLKDELADLKHRVSLLSQKNNSFSGIQFKQMQRLSKMTGMVNTIGDVVENWQDCEYMVEKKDSESVTFTPYDIRPIAQRIFQCADKVLMMSATISNPKEFAKSLGIKENEFEYIEIKSTFEAQKSPIFCSTKHNLSYANMAKDLPRVLDLALQICDNHKGEKGIIHTHTNQITEALKKKIRNQKRQFLFREIGTSNEDIVKIHKEEIDADTVLVSPSLDTGLSLDGDLGRFQIIIKAPYMPLRSKRIKKMFEKNKEHYSMKMLDSLIQMCGRCTRSSEDHSITYILDGVAVKAVMNNKRNLPKHFLERFQ